METKCFGSVDFEAITKSIKTGQPQALYRRQNRQLWQSLPINLDLRDHSKSWSTLNALRLSMMFFPFEDTVRISRLSKSYFSHCEEKGVPCKELWITDESAFVRADLANQLFWTSTIYGVSSLCVHADVSGRNGLFPPIVARLLIRNNSTLTSLLVDWQQHPRHMRCLMTFGSLFSGWWNKDYGGCLKVKGGICQQSPEFGTLKQSSSALTGFEDCTDSAVAGDDLSIDAASSITRATSECPAGQTEGKEEKTTTAHDRIAALSELLKNEQGTLMSSQTASSTATFYNDCQGLPGIRSKTKGKQKLSNLPILSAPPGRHAMRRDSNFRLKPRYCRRPSNAPRSPKSDNPKTNSEQMPVDSITSNFEQTEVLDPMMLTEWNAWEESSLVSCDSPDTSPEHGSRSGLQGEECEGLYSETAVEDESDLTGVEREPVSDTCLNAFKDNALVDDSLPQDKYTASIPSVVSPHITAACSCDEAAKDLAKESGEPETPIATFPQFTNSSNSFADNLSLPQTSVLHQSVIVDSTSSLPSLEFPLVTTLCFVVKQANAFVFFAKCKFPAVKQFVLFEDNPSYNPACCTEVLPTDETSATRYDANTETDGDNKDGNSDNAKARTYPASSRGLQLCEDSAHLPTLSHFLEGMPSLVIADLLFGPRTPFKFRSDSTCYRQTQMVYRAVLKTAPNLRHISVRWSTIMAKEILRLPSSQRPKLLRFQCEGAYASLMSFPLQFCDAMPSCRLYFPLLHIDIDGPQPNQIQGCAITDGIAPALSDLPVNFSERPSARTFNLHSCNNSPKFECRSILSCPCDHDPLTSATAANTASFEQGVAAAFTQEEFSRRQPEEDCTRHGSFADDVESVHKLLQLILQLQPHVEALWLGRFPQALASLFNLKKSVFAEASIIAPKSSTEEDKLNDFRWATYPNDMPFANICVSSCYHFNFRYFGPSVLHSVPLSNTFIRDNSNISVLTDVATSNRTDDGSADESAASILNTQFQFPRVREIDVAPWSSTDSGTYKSIGQFLQRCKFSGQERRLNEFVPQPPVIFAPCNCPCQTVCSLSRVWLEITSLSQLDAICNVPECRARIRGLSGHIDVVLQAARYLTRCLHHWNKPPLRVIELLLESSSPRRLMTIERFNHFFGCFPILKEVRVIIQGLPTYLKFSEVFHEDSPEAAIVGTILGRFRFTRSLAGEKAVLARENTWMLIFTRRSKLGEKLSAALKGPSTPIPNCPVVQPPPCY